MSEAPDPADYTQDSLHDPFDAEDYEAARERTEQQLNPNRPSTRSDVLGHLRSASRSVAWLSFAKPY
jgi:hypothetical protein